MSLTLTPHSTAPLLNCSTALTFPLDALPPLLADLTQSLADAFQIDTQAVALPMLTIAGAAIGNSRRVAVSPGISSVDSPEFPQPLSHPAALWSVILDDCPARTNRAINLLLQPLIDRQLAFTHDLHSRYRHYQYDINAWQEKRHQRLAERDNRPNPKPLHPTRDYKQYFFTTPDLSQLPRYFRRQPRGVLLACADLSPLFRPHFTHLPDHDLLPLFDANPHTFDAANSLPARFVANAFIAITGSLTSSLAASTPIARHSHLPHSFLIASQTRPFTNLTPGHIDPALRTAWKSLIDSLYSLEPENYDTNPTPHLIPVPPKSHPVLIAAEQRLLAAAHTEPGGRGAVLRFPAEPEAQHTLSGGGRGAVLRNCEAGCAAHSPAHLTRLVDYLPRLALILQLTDAKSQPLKNQHAPDPSITPEFVDGHHISQAAKIIDWLTAQSTRLYADESSNFQKYRTTDILTLIKRHDGQITLRDLMRHRFEFKTSKQARDYLQQLETQGYGRLLYLNVNKRSTLTFKLIDIDTNPTGAPKNRDGVNPLL